MTGQRGSRLRELVARARKRYSIMVLEGPEGKLRHFSLPAIVIPVALLVLVLGLTGGGASLLQWTSARVEQARVAHLRAENARLVAQIEEIRASVEMFEDRMRETVELTQGFRNLANLEVVPEEVSRLGIGGPPPLSELADEVSPSVSVRRARDVLDRVDDLSRQAVFQSASLEEIVDALEASQDELAHIPSVSPVRRGWISSRYGMRPDPFTGRSTMHRGIDVSAWTGTPVYATADGRVRKAGRGGYLGLIIEIDHGNGIVTRYGHNSRLLVKAGQRVRRGDVIAEVGSTGRSTSPHVHYEIHVDGRHLNPLRYILDGGPRVSNGA